MHRALGGGASVFPDAPLPLAGARGRWAPALDGRLLANAVRGQRGGVWRKTCLIAMPSARVLATTCIDADIFLHRHGFRLAPNNNLHLQP